MSEPKPQPSEAAKAAASEMEFPNKALVNCFCPTCQEYRATVIQAAIDQALASQTEELTELARDKEQAAMQIKHWALSLPEHPKWAWLRDEMLDAAAKAKP